VPEKKIVARMRHQYAAVHRLRGDGMSKSEIGRRLGLHPATVRKLANAASLQELTAKTDQRAHLVDDYLEYLHQRWNCGERNATELFREIVAVGYQGGELAVHRYLRRFRDDRCTQPIAAPKPPSVREVTNWTLTHPDRLPEPCAVALKTVLTRSRALLVDHGHSDTWLTLHQASFIAWISVTGIHFLGHLQGAVVDTGRELRRSTRDPAQRGKAVRWVAVAVAAALLVGVGLAAAFTPAASSWQLHHDHHGAIQGR
jgi:hypothetical protein